MKKNEKNCFKRHVIFCAAALIALIAVALNTEAQISSESISASSASLQSPTQLIVNYELTNMPDKLKPGGSGTLIIVIQNTGGLGAKTVKARIPDTGFISGGGSWNLGTIDAGQSRTIKATLNAAKNAYTGTHTINLFLEYTAYERDSMGGLDSHDESTNWAVPVRVYGTSNFQVNAVKNVFYKDVSDDLVLELMVNNNVSSLRDVSAVLSSECISIIGLEEIHIGDLDRNRIFMLNYTIKPVVVGVCPLSVLFKYEDGSGNTNTEVVSLGVDVKRPDIDFKVIEVSYPALSPGDTGEIILGLKNVGSTGAFDVSVDLGLGVEDISAIPQNLIAQMAGVYPFAMVNSHENYFDRFEAGESRNTKFKISVNKDAESKSYEIPLKIRYYDGAGIEHRIMKTVGLEVKGDINLASGIDKSDVSQDKRTGDVVVSIVNKGSGGVKFLSVRLMESDEYDVLSKNEDYIGDLKSDDYDTVTYMIKARENVDIVHLIISLEYRDNYNKNYFDNQTISLKLLSKSDLNKGFDFSVLIILPVFAVLGYLFYRKVLKR